jgi:folate-binding protein YgfZ
VFFAWEPAAWLRVSGADAFTFLQGQFTNDLRSLGVDGAVYGLWLNHKGRVLADSFVLRGTGAEEFWVGSYFSPATVIRERLEAFVIADDVVVEDETEKWSGVTVWEEGAKLEVSGAKRFAGRRTSEGVTEWMFPRNEREGVRVSLSGSVELSGEEMERRRILAGVPAVPRDIGPGELPNEGGLEEVAISYTKGCYLGQEVMARLKSMGQVRRRLVRVRGRGESPVLPAEVFQGDKRVGELRSAVREGDGFVGLALVSLLNVRAEAGLALAAGSEEAVTLFPGELGS